jgi:hypothetical protein
LCTIEKKDELILNDEFYFQLWKLNKGQHAIFEITRTRKECIWINHYICFSQEEHTSKTFTFLLLIQGLFKHYNKKLGSDSLKQKAILMAFTSKTTFNIDGTTIHLALSLPLNCKHL